MVRRSMFLPALVAVAGVLAGGWVSPASAAPATTPATTPNVASTAKPSAYDPALEVTLSSLTPSYLPERGPIRVTGSVTNADDVPWTAINVHSFFGAEPMLSQAELVAAAEADPLLDVGERIVATEASDKIDALQPGETESFSLVVPRELLEPVGPGVYWFGVHALGESVDEPRDDIAVADGRARTFLPYIPRGTPGTVKTSLVLPVRHVLGYLPDGSLGDLKHWRRTLSDQGRLRDLVDFAAGAGDTPVTWLVDPALPDAIRRLSVGNPPRSLAATDPPEDPDDDGEESPSGDPSPTVDPSLVPDEQRELTDEEQETADAATNWLLVFEQALQGDEVLTLPYGDLDVAAAAELDPGLYELARERPGAVLTSWGVTTRPAVAAPSGYLNAAGFEIASDDTVVLATDRMFGDDPPGVATVDGKKVAVLSSGAATGGPSPGEQLTSVQLRQRILSEAAIRLLTPGRPPLVVSLPLDWHPDDPTTFFSGLEVDWVELTTLADATDRDGRAVEAAGLDYPTTQQRRQLDPPVFNAVTGLIEAGTTLQNVLTLNSRVAQTITDEGLSGVSYGSRAAPADARMRLDNSREWIAKQLDKVSISTGPGVTLSGSDGSFAAVITNDLDQPVTVNVVARSNGGVEIPPVEEVQLGPGNRTTVVLDAHAIRVGVTNVTLGLADVDGNPLGSTDELPIRSAQVSDVIWVIIGVGVGLLFLAILVRLFRRIRSASRKPVVDEHDPPPDPGREPSREPGPDPRPRPSSETAP